MKNFLYDFSQRYRNLLLGFSVLSVLLISPVLANSFYNYEHEEHIIPLCAPEADIDLSGSMKIDIKSYFTQNDEANLVCGAIIYTVNDMDTKDALESILEIIDEKYHITDYYYKNNIMWIESSSEQRNYYHGVIVADSAHIVQFLTAAEFDSTAQEALNYMIANFR